MFFVLPDISTYLVPRVSIIGIFEVQISLNLMNLFVSAFLENESHKEAFNFWKILIATYPAKVIMLCLKSHNKWSLTEFTINTT